MERQLLLYRAEAVAGGIVRTVFCWGNGRYPYFGFEDDSTGEELLDMAFPIPGNANKMGM